MNPRILLMKNFFFFSPSLRKLNKAEITTHTTTFFFSLRVFYPRPAQLEAGDEGRSLHFSWKQCVLEKIKEASSQSVTWLEAP